MTEHLLTAATLAYSSRSHGDPWPAYLLGTLWFLFVVVVIGRKALQARKRQKDEQARSLGETDWTKQQPGGS